MTIRTLASAILLSAIPVAAFAATPETIVHADRDRASLSVSFADLNLADARGVSRLEWRIKSAARSLCLTAGRKPVAFEQREAQCVSEAIDDAQSQVAAAIGSFGTDVASRAIAVRKRG